MHVKMHEEALCQNEQVIMDTQQIELKSTDESLPHYCVDIWLKRIIIGAGKYQVRRSKFPFVSNTKQHTLRK